MCASSELEDSNKSGPTAGHWSVQNQFYAQGTDVSVFAGNIILLTSIYIYACHLDSIYSLYFEVANS